MFASTELTFLIRFVSIFFLQIHDVLILLGAKHRYIQLKIHLPSDALITVIFSGSHQTIVISSVENAGSRSNGNYFTNNIGGECQVGFNLQAKWNYFPR